MSALETGKIIGNCRLTDRIAGGGVGDVYRAVDLALDRPVAIKVLRSGLPDHDDVRARFRSEARTLARLDHPNIATLYSLVEERGELYMVMEFVQGKTFATLVRESGRLEPGRAFHLLHQALDGLAHAHDAGVVHRDVKSSNLMLSERGVVKVMDFGIARGPGSARMTRFGSVIGTPEFMAPEQIRGEDATARSDVYSLAIVLFELLTGRLPFEGNEYDVLRAQVEQPAPSLRALGAEISEALEAEVLRALDKRPEPRPDGMRAFQHGLVDAGAPKPSVAHTGSLAIPATGQVQAVLSASAPTQELALESATAVLRPKRSGEPLEAGDAARADTPGPTVQLDVAGRRSWRAAAWLTAAAAASLLGVAWALSGPPVVESPAARPKGATHVAEGAPGSAAEADSAAEPGAVDEAQATSADGTPRGAARPAAPARRTEDSEGGSEGWIIRR